jgi:hypothetical protein
MSHGSGCSKQHTAICRFQLKQPDCPISSRLLIIEEGSLDQELMRRSEGEKTASGHSLLGRANSKSGDVSYAPIATKFCSAAKRRDWPKPDLW